MSKKYSRDEQETGAITRHEAIEVADFIDDHTGQVLAALTAAAEAMDAQFRPTMDDDEIAAHALDDPAQNADAHRALIAHTAECDVVFNGCGWVLHADTDYSLRVVFEPETAQRREQRLLDEWEAQQSRNMLLPYPFGATYQPFDPVSARLTDIGAMIDAQLPAL